MVSDPFKDLDTFNSVHPASQDVTHTEDDLSNTHFVHPHWVNPYIKEDGTAVSGYWRDGHGDNHHNLDTEHGGGYIAHDPTHGHE